MKQLQIFQSKILPSREGYSSILHQNQEELNHFQSYRPVGGEIRVMINFNGDGGRGIVCGPHQFFLDICKQFSTTQMQLHY